MPLVGGGALLLRVEHKEKNVFQGFQGQSEKRAYLCKKMAILQHLNTALSSERHSRGSKKNWASCLNHRRRHFVTE